MKLIIFAGLVAAVSMCQVQAVLINKVFYHRGQCEDKLVFYFDSQVHVSKQVGPGYVDYTMHQVQLAPAAQNVLFSIPDLDLNYQLNFKLNDGKLNIKMQFNSDLISKIYAARFKPISQPYGIAIKIIRAGFPKKKPCERKAHAKAIVLDCGHGGEDFGASFGTIYEKDVTLQVGLKLAQILKQQGYKIYLTRTDDYFVPLDRRTYFANLHTDASLFISLHANYASNPRVRGLETYYMHYDLFNHIDDAGKVSRYLLNRQSNKLAHCIHTQVLEHLGVDKLADRKIKQSVSQVLLGVEMPAILIELGFLSNSKEAQLLDSPSYQWALAKGIGHGINAYFAPAPLS